MTNDGRRAAASVRSVSRRKVRGARAPAATAPPRSGAFPIVAVGASAGGLHAFRQLLERVPADSGMAFVLIQHLDPHHRSLLVEALGRSTKMPIAEVADGALVQPNHVYVIPENADLSIREGRLVLAPRRLDPLRQHLPIDAFFRALAGDRGRRAIGVVLSGTASDGTEGLRAIKAEGGLTFAQDPDTAKFAGMPRSAVDAGVVDHSLPIPRLAQELLRLGHHPYVLEDAVGPSGHDEADVARIVDILKTAVGVDFGEYKFPTFQRRLARRMALCRMSSAAAYLGKLERDPVEVHALYEDMLIHVTSFFREPKAFAALKTSVFPEIVKHKAEGAPIRLWAAGCSTGEEAYSLVITLLEFLGDARPAHPIQMFASDVSDKAIEKARAGLYTESSLREVSDEQRRRYFTKVDNSYRINKSVRDLCVFVRHDLARDPPFSKLDLVSCRNVLIYFDQALQKRVVPTLHYSLAQPGFLLLGRSEHVAGFARLFTPVDRAAKIFARASGPSALTFAPRPERHLAQASAIPGRGQDGPQRRIDLGRYIDRLLLARYAPPGVLVNEKLEVLQFRGETGAFLQPAPGEPQTNLIKMARTGLLPELRAAVTRAKQQMAPVRTSGVQVDDEGSTKSCDLVVVPVTSVPDMKEPLFVVLFEEAPTPKRTRARAPSAGRPGAGRRGRLPRLEHELAATKDYLHALIEEHGRAADDLGSANEELISGNEELQSLNEELETAKEELESTNEELTTVNDELHSRNQEVSRVNSDLVNLLATVNVPVLILDKQRRIRRFTPQARLLFSVLPSDVGRLLDDIKANIVVPDLDQQVAQVIETVVAREAEVQDQAGRWYRMQIRPYKSVDDVVDGAILSLFDIDELKRNVAEAQRADRAKDAFLAMLSHELRTPLAHILLQAQMLQRGAPDKDKLGRATSAIVRSVKLQTQLVDDLLDVSSILVGKLKLDMQVVDLTAVVKVAIDRVADSAAGKAIALKASLSADVGTVAGDQTRLEQIVTNLLTNAVKFTSQGGAVEVSLAAADGHARLTVADNGVGIDAAFLPHVFTRFAQENSTTTRAHGGLGLGLAIVSHLVKAHGGTVTARSPGPGMGASFEVTLPRMAGSTKLDLARAEAADGDPLALDGRLRHLRVLVVDDDSGTREVLTDMLTSSGAKVKTAGSAAEGITALGEFRPDVLLCDIAMPAEDGCAFIARVRALGVEQGGRTPAAALTALAADADRARALAAGFQLYVAKPVDIGRLVSTVVELAQERNGPAPEPPDGASKRTEIAH